MQQYTRAYDGLRGLAISLVVLHHLTLRDRWHIGPEIFFVLSGYLITRSLQRTQDDRPFGVLSRFYKRRLLRLWLPTFVMLAFIFTFAIVIVPDRFDILRNMIASSTFTMNWQQALTPWRSNGLGHLWSLAAEQQFYLIWPPLFLLCSPRWIRAVLAGLLCALTVWRVVLLVQGADYDRLYFGPDTHADALVAGCLLALTSLPARVTPWLRTLGPWAMATSVASAIVLPVRSPIMLCLSTTAITLLSVLVVAATPLEGRLNRLLSLPALQMLGRMSFSLYLWHYPAIWFLNPHFSHGNRIVQLSLALVLSALAYVLVEKPSVAYLKTRRAVRGDAGAASISGPRTDRWVYSAAPSPAATAG